MVHRKWEKWAKRKKEQKDRSMTSPDTKIEKRASIMSIDMMKDFLKHSYQFSRIPACLIHGNETVSYPSDCTVPKVILEYFLQSDKECLIQETTIGSYWGALKLEDSNFIIILGPVSSRPYTDETLKRYFFDYNIHSSERDRLFYYYPLIPQYSYLDLSHLLSQMSIAFHGAPTSPFSIPSPDQSANALDSTPNLSLKKQQYSESGYSNKLWEHIKIFLPLIQTGEIEELTRLSYEITDYSYGNYSLDAKQNSLITMIMTSTLAMSAAIQGGVDENTAYTMLEACIHEAMTAKSGAEVNQISQMSSYHFALKVREIQDQPIVHSSVYEIMQYIRSNIYLPMTVTALADQFGYSLGYFSRLFKRETGFGVNVFINSCRLHEARQLLKTTGLSISEISNMLHFSSQSYFQKKFKEQFHISPMKYRKESQNPRRGKSTAGIL